MKILAIHSNKVFFKDGVPNFYGWLCGQRGRTEEFATLNEKYKVAKERGPLLLKGTYELAVGGLAKDELLDYANQYNEEYFNGAVKDELERLGGEYKIMIFTSLPKELYEHLREENLVAGVFGAEGYWGEGDKIEGMAEIKLKNTAAVKEKMEQIGLGESFTLTPNRYGLLESLIDEMIEANIKEEDVVLLGKETTAIPMREVSAKQIENFGDL